MLQTLDLSVGYPGPPAQLVLADLGLTLPSGQLTALLGLNGTGKSTLLRSLAGLQPLLRGQVQVQGRALTSLTGPQRAQCLSLVLTGRPREHYLTVEALVQLGRYPYGHWLRPATPADQAAVDQALALTGTESLRHQPVNRLSDGQAQKVMIARALAQAAPVMLLDEPTAHLDVANRVAVMQLLHQVAHQQNQAVLVATHDLELALQLADQLWLIDHHQPQVLCGPPEQLALEGHLGRVLAGPGTAFNLAQGRFVATEAPPPRGRAVGLQGDPVGRFWVQRFLEKRGIGIAQGEAQPSLLVEVVQTNNGFGWRLNGQWAGQSLTELLNRIAN
ncbi:MAG: ABC transporter ATP-binding protein [Bernardetiaceae bacterium]|nr:ABC transporter ATP-binding protein [Bernardetiaceae bacterium]